MGKIIKVKNAVQLAAAIKAATGGETILLAPGDYGEVVIKNKLLTDPVTIKSAYADNDASMTYLRVDKSSGFRIEDVDIHHVLKPGESVTATAAYVSNAHNIDFVKVEFSGSLDGNAWNDGYGLRVAGSTGISVVNSSFEQLNRGATFSASEGLVISGNDLVGVREGFQFSNVDDVMINRNLFTGFTPNYAVGDHSDAIQFLNIGTDGSHHVVIRDNAILMGANGGTQGIFIGLENQASRHSDFTIENNLYNGEARHGIGVFGVDGVVIRGNTVTSAANARLEAGISYTANTGMTIDHNIAPMMVDGGRNIGFAVHDNIDLWDPKTKLGISLADIFGQLPHGTALDAYLVRAGGLAAGLHAGFNPFEAISSGHFGLISLPTHGRVDNAFPDMMVV